MTPLRVLELEPDASAPGARRAALAGCRWLAEVRVQALAGGASAPWQQRSGDDESLLVVLSGTFDLQAGAGAWPGRGTRALPFAGRPVALFVPPRTRLAIGGGPGELLLVTARRPVAAAADPAAAAVAAAESAPPRKPLLALAGSNKAFDHASGEWRMQESFPLAPEAILPRRIEQRDCGGVVVERVFPFAYKAVVLCLDEAVLASGQTLAVPAPDVPREVHYEPELAIYVRGEDGAVCEVRCGGDAVEVRGERVVLAGSGRGCTLAVRGGRCYVALVHGGSKLNAD